jgi:hypothetical protein
MKARLFFTLVSVLTAGWFTCTALAGSPVFDFDREFYPYYPSLIKWNKSRVEFTPPSACAGCHEKEYKEWTGSVHHLAFRYSSHHISDLHRNDAVNEQRCLRGCFQREVRNDR